VATINDEASKILVDIASPHICRATVRIGRLGTIGLLLMSRIVETTPPMKIPLGCI
jgi:hypothetical protein